MRRRRQRKPALAGVPGTIADVIADDGPRVSRAAIGGWIKRHFLLRLHMTVIIASTIGAGIAATDFFTIMAVNVLAVRYALSVISAYCAFLALLRLWLWYVGIQVARSAQQSSVDINASGFDVTDFNIGNYLSGLRPGGASVDVSSFSSAGGQFGGGGATGSWGDAAASTGSSSSKGGDSFFGLDFGDDSGAIFVVIAIVVAVVVAACAAFYLIYAAPAILSEVAFEGVLAVAMARKTKHMSNIGWIGAVSKKTFWPFFAVTAAAVGVGWVAQYVCPTAHTIAQALHCAPL